MTIFTYTAPADGAILTTCGQHRTLGYTFAGGRMVCRGCGEGQQQHETAAETVERNRRMEFLRQQECTEAEAESIIRSYVPWPDSKKS